MFLVFFDAKLCPLRKLDTRPRIANHNSVRFLRPETRWGSSGDVTIVILREIPYTLYILCSLYLLEAMDTALLLLLWQGVKNEQRFEKGQRGSSLATAVVRGSETLPPIVLRFPS